MATAVDDTQIRNRWRALVFISMAQLMVALDATVINIALPSAQHALHISDPARQWVITAYTLAFGGLLLLGGRLADVFGRRTSFLVGLVGFATASAAGGASRTFAELVIARAAQGAFAALVSPAALSLLAVTFTEARERAKAFAVFGAIAGTGGALGLLLGGTLTEYAQWRWCLFVNVPVAVTAFLGARRYLARTPGQRGAALDLRGVLLVTLGLVSVVFGFSNAASHGWSSTTTVAWVGIGVALIALFVRVEAATSSPLLSLRILADRNRGGSYLAIGLAVVAMYGLFLLLTYDFQVVQRYSPARAGLAFMPLSLAVMVSSTTASRALLPRVAPRMLMAPGLLVGAAGMATLATVHAHAAYVSHILPAELLLGLGMGAVFVPAFSTATSGVGPREVGVASAVANTSQQVGASLGTAVLNTVAATATARYVAAHRLGSGAAALVHGYGVAATFAAVVLAAAAVVVAVMVTVGPPELRGASSGA